jgi:hypothetical protein
MAVGRPLTATVHAALLLLLAGGARAETSADAFVRELHATMAALRSESAVSADGIRAAYGGGAGLEALTDREALRQARSTGRITSLPLDALLFNMRPRLGGAHPIGERDRQYQDLYVGADPAALGCLLHVAARVRSSPVEVTSLVRHLEYQRQLQKTNRNAATELPLHAFGLAFDISVLNVPLHTSREIRDVLRAMRDAGDLFFVAETRQLVFHVVPAPARLSFYRELYAALTSLPPAAGSLHVERNLLAAAQFERAATPAALPVVLPAAAVVVVAVIGAATRGVIRGWLSLPIRTSVANGGSSPRA